MIFDAVHLQTFQRQYFEGYYLKFDSCLIIWRSFYLIYWWYIVVHQNIIINRKWECHVSKSYHFINDPVPLEFNMEIIYQLHIFVFNIVLWAVKLKIYPLWWHDCGGWSWAFRISLVIWWYFYRCDIFHNIAIVDLDLTHCGLLTPYNNKDLGQHWPR